jgi:predicted GIY-YIG superfamily endonuclease
MANKRDGTLYTGVTSDLPKRAYEHREGVSKGLSAKYNAKYWSGTNCMTACSKLFLGRSKSRLAVEQLNWR